MNQFNGKVAVITGAASGIGRGLAERCAKEGMKIVIGDIEKESLLQVENELKSAGVETLAVVTDVSKEQEIRALAEKTMETFGHVHLLFNNAGVRVETSIVNSAMVDWRWVIDVNLYGVIHGVKTFVPIMMNQGEGGYIINTASRAGLETWPFDGICAMTKHAVVSLSETLYHELKMINSPVRVSVLCPGFSRTRILDSERNRPTVLRSPMKPHFGFCQNKVWEALMQEAVENGMSVKKIVDITFAAIEKEQFYILPDRDIKTAVKKRMDNIMNESNPNLYIPEAVGDNIFFNS